MGNPFPTQQTINKKKIVETVVQIHEERGGLPSEAQNVSEITIYPALSKLKKSGIANNPSIGYWRIGLNPDLSEIEVPESVELPHIPDEKATIKPDLPSEKCIGSGESAVYLYYLPAYRRLAESQGKSVWECKVGRTDNDLVLIVKSQTATAIPEEPEIALIIPTDAPSDMEKAIHAILTVRGRRKEEAQGREWFMTSPREVEEIDAFIVS